MLSGSHDNINNVGGVGGGCLEGWGGDEFLTHVSFIRCLGRLLLCQYP